MRGACSAVWRTPSTLHMWIPQVETACIINIHYSGYETLIIFGPATSTVCVMQGFFLLIKTPNTGFPLFTKDKMS